MTLAILTRPTGEQRLALEVMYEDWGLTQRQIANRLGVALYWVRMRMIDFAIPRRSRSERRSGAAAGAVWKGGRPQRMDGYRLVLQKGHSRANRGGYVFEHILVAEEKYGRTPLKGSECVHHIDFDKGNNSPDNLVLTDRSTHAQWHGTLEAVVRPLIAAGVVAFSEERGYFLAESNG